MHAWNAQIDCEVLCNCWGFTCCFADRDREQSVFSNVLAVPAIRTVVDEPRRIDAEKPNSDDGSGDVFLANHVKAERHRSRGGDERVSIIKKRDFAAPVHRIVLPSMEAQLR